MTSKGIGVDGCDCDCFTYFVLSQCIGITGENRVLLDKRLGIYIFDDLKVLKNAKSPAILLEAGVIVSPMDEQRVQTPKFMNDISLAILKAIK